ncbi:DUF1161 domain-containing protein [Dokdonella sp. MW10]|uniref:DUF1161 domain-containing protein n=1 Tax=Dokdonella sp. MW10 TaxID=2992926 RepID=UPI003F7E5BD0
MKTSCLLSLLMLASLEAHAAGQRKPCEDLQREIAAKIDARGVAAYTLEVVTPDAVGEARVVGSCDGGTRRITYVRQAVEAPRALAAVQATRD